MDKKFVLMNLLGIVIIIMASFFTFTTIKAQNFEEQFQTGLQLFEEGKFEESVPFFLNVIQLGPTNIEARIKLADAYIHLEDYTSSIEILQSGVELTPLVPDFYLKIADINIIINDIDSALLTLSDGINQVALPELENRLEELTSNLSIQTERTYLEPGMSRTFTIFWQNSSNERVPLDAEWSLSNEELGELLNDTNGKTAQFIGNEVGTSTIIATLPKSNLSINQDIHIVDELVEHLLLNPIEESTININQTIELTANATNIEGEEIDINPEWFTSDNSVISILNTNSLIAEIETLSTGEASITVQYQDLTSDINVVVIDDNELSITENIEGNGRLVYSVPPEDLNYESTFSVEAIAEDGYQFVGWLNDLSGTQNPYEITLTEPITIGASFEKLQYQLNFNKDGSGKIQVSPSKSFYDHNETISILATPESGWTFSHWTGDIQSSEARLDVTVTDDLTVGAVFTRENSPEMENELENLPIDNETNSQEAEHLLSLSISGDGSISKSPFKEYFSQGETATITARPNEGSRFVGWQGDIESNQPVLTVTMNQSMNIRAVFEQSNQPENSDQNLEEETE
ncbi:hypothetical protein BTS2_1886 [Bacillus sp. TS-2]|nr:hypothetical protein BTS2_1886 [Bacillus sp. TS-2]